MSIASLDIDSPFVLAAARQRGLRLQLPQSVRDAIDGFVDDTMAQDWWVGGESAAEGGDEVDA
ncbi:MAG: hypothetical protein FJ271_22200 [Planctomycetes bacterium]|nr:hypothetical protein [Planctomycetota bacterium]